MKKPASRKLSLTVVTLRPLASTDLAFAEGGSLRTTRFRIGVYTANTCPSDMPDPGEGI